MRLARGRSAPRCGKGTAQRRERGAEGGGNCVSCGREKAPLRKAAALAHGTAVNDALFREQVKGAYLREAMHALHVLHLPVEEEGVVVVLCAAKFS